MEPDIIAGQWKQLKGEIKRRWGKLTDDDLTQAEGSMEKLVGRIQERYGYTKERAQQEVQELISVQP
ncbi:MAG: CsbD family protein [Vicinamibacteraceae bacterium]